MPVRTTDEAVQAEVLTEGAPRLVIVAVTDARELSQVPSLMATWYVVELVSEGVKNESFCWKASAVPPVGTVYHRY